MNERVRPGPNRGRRLWDAHGSWLILIIVVAVSWNGGMEWQDRKTHAVVNLVIENARTERDDLRARLRAVNDRNIELARALGPAVQKAAEASTKASEAVDKANQLIEDTAK